MNAISKILFVLISAQLIACGGETSTGEERPPNNSNIRFQQNENESAPNPNLVRLPQDVNPEFVNVIPTNTIKENDQVVANAIQQITGLEKMVFPQLEGEWQGEMAVKGTKQDTLLFVDKFGMVMIDLPDLAKITHLTDIKPHEENAFLANMTLNGQQLPIKVEYSNARIEFIARNAESVEYTFATFGRKKQQTQLDIATLNDLKLSSKPSTDQQTGLEMYFDKSGNGVMSLGDCKMSANAVDNITFTTIRFIPREDAKCQGFGLKNASTSIVKMNQNNELEIRFLDENNARSQRLNIDLETLLVSSAVVENGK